VAFEPRPAGLRDGFLARTARYDVTLAADRAVFHLKPADKSSPRLAPDAIGMTLVGARPRAAVEAASPLRGKVNYLLGSDPAAWRRNVPTYGRLLTRDAWPGVDVAYYGTAGHLETDFVVAPGGDPERVALDFTGARDVGVDRDGALNLTASDGQTISLLAPSVYQNDGAARTPVSARYVLEPGPTDDGRRVRFAIGAYDRTKTLVIDPLALVMAYSTYVDPDGDNVAAEGLAVDEHGHPFVAGSDATFTDNTFPVPSYGFVTKYSADGQEVLWTTYLGEGLSHSVDDVFNGTFDGRTNLTEVTAIALDGEHAVITGWTNAPHFPHTPGAFHNPNLGAGIGPFVYVAKLTVDGDDVVYAARPIAIGKAYGVAVDNAGRAFVVGYTQDDVWLPTTTNAAIPTMPSYYSGFLVELSANGGTVVYGTYIGARGGESGGDTFPRGVAVDPSGAAYVVGGTDAHHFITRNAFQPHSNDTYCSISLGGEGFVMKFDAHHQLAYSSYLGGACLDNATAVAVGAGGAAYVTGSTEGGGFPCVQSAFPCNPVGVPAAFVTKVNPDGMSLAYSTILGPGEGLAIAAHSGNAFVTGSTSSYAFPVRRALQPAIAGGDDAFVSQVRDDGFGLVFSTLLGGSANDVGTAIAIGVNRGIYVAGRTESTDFPVHRANLRHDPFGIPNGFLTKLKLESVDPQHD
jgi:hypothetical protein